jgi:tRNA A37 threonylcarbamoyladenosine biosynthesis protein TsaE
VRRAQNRPTLVRRGTMNGPVTLLGPYTSGKTTVGRLLAKALGRPFHHLIELPEWEASGFGRAVADSALAEHGPDGHHRYAQPFRAQTIEQVVAARRDIVLELGPLGSVFHDPDLLERVRRALAPVEPVILLRPSPDDDASFAALEERQHAMSLLGGIDLNEHFVRHPSNRRVAKIVVYTKNRTPEETRDEILARLDRSAPEVILIGPVCVGKSTQGRLLAQALGRPQASVDALCIEYYRELGWDDAVQRVLE